VPATLHLAMHEVLACVMLIRQFPLALDAVNPEQVMCRIGRGGVCFASIHNTDSDIGVLIAVDPVHGEL
jgi:hypothetical protein